MKTVSKYLSFSEIGNRSRDPMADRTYEGRHQITSALLGHYGPGFQPNLCYATKYHPIMKTRVKRVSSTQLSVCGICPGEDFILIGDVITHDPRTLCIVCEDT